MRHRFTAAQISSSPGGTSGKERRSEFLSSRRGREAAHLSTWRGGHRTCVAELAGQPASISAGQLPGRRHRQRRTARSSSPGEGHARRGLSAGEYVRRAHPQGGGVTRPLRRRVWQLVGGKFRANRRVGPSARGVIMRDAGAWARILHPIILKPKLTSLSGGSVAICARCSANRSRASLLGWVSM